MQCPVCQTALIEESDFCHKCGARIDANTAEGTAPSSGEDGIIAQVGATVLGTLDKTMGREAEGEPASVDRYEILHPLGKKSGQGVVYKARDRRLDRFVAIKRIKKERSASPIARQRLLAEARAMASLSHYNIVTVHEVGEDANGVYIVMECVDGEDLETKLRRDGKLDPERAIEITRQLCNALRLAHGKKIIHRDIKPSNILIDQEGVPKLVDFGLAQVGEQHDVTATGVALGTRAYMSPEQRRDAKHIEPSSDIYSLGATLYQMLTGPPPEVINREMLPEELRHAVMKALEHDPAERYASVEEFSAALGEARLGDADSLVRKAEERYRLGDLEEATDLYRRALGMDPGRKSARRRIEEIASKIDLVRRARQEAIERANNGDLEGAVEAWRRVLAIAPGDEEAARQLVKMEEALRNQQLDTAVDNARHRLNAGEYKLASEQCAIALRLDPDNEEARAILKAARGRRIHDAKEKAKAGQESYRRKQYALAADSLSQAFDLLPEDHPDLVKLEQAMDFAVVLQCLSEADQAIDAERMEEAIVLLDRAAGRARPYENLIHRVERRRKKVAESQMAAATATARQQRLRKTWMIGLGATTLLAVVVLAGVKIQAARTHSAEQAALGRRFDEAVGQDDFREAERILEQIGRSDPNGAMYRGLRHRFECASSLSQISARCRDGRYLEEAKSLARAVKYSETFEELFGAKRRELYKTAAMWEKSGQYAKALGTLDVLDLLHPGHPGAADLRRDIHVAMRPPEPPTVSSPSPSRTGSSGETASMTPSPDNSVRAAPQTPKASDIASAAPQAEEDLWSNLAGYSVLTVCQAISGGFQPPGMPTARSEAIDLPNRFRLSGKIVLIRAYNGSTWVFLRTETEANAPPGFMAFAGVEFQSASIVDLMADYRVGDAAEAVVEKKNWGAFKATAEVRPDGRHSALPYGAMPNYPPECRPFRIQLPPGTRPPMYQPTPYGGGGAEPAFAYPCFPGKAIQIKDRRGTRIEATSIGTQAPARNGVEAASMGLLYRKLAESGLETMTVHAQYRSAKKENGRVVVEMDVIDELEGQISVVADFRLPVQLEEFLGYVAGDTVEADISTKRPTLSVRSRNPLTDLASAIWQGSINRSYSPGNILVPIGPTVSRADDPADPITAWNAVLADCQRIEKPGDPETRISPAGPRRIPKGNTPTADELYVHSSKWLNQETTLSGTLETVLSHDGETHLKVRIQKSAYGLAYFEAFTKQQGFGQDTLDYRGTEGGDGNKTADSVSVKGIVRDPKMARYRLDSRALYILEIREVWKDSDPISSRVVVGRRRDPATIDKSRVPTDLALLLRQHPAPGEKVEFVALCSSSNSHGKTVTVRPIEYYASVEVAFPEMGKNTFENYKYKDRVRVEAMGDKESSPTTLKLKGIRIEKVSKAP